MLIQGYALGIILISGEWADAMCECSHLVQFCKLVSSPIVRVFVILLAHLRVVFALQKAINTYTCRYVIDVDLNCIYLYIGNAIYSQHLLYHA